jgi:predicted nucleic acid-binding protein
LTFLIDTNVISEPRRTQPDPNVIAWFQQTDSTQVYISVLTIGELARGATKAARRDAAAGVRLHRWLGEIDAEYSDRMIAVDRDTATLWGKLTSARTMPMVDALLAATALVHGMTLVTRNVRDVLDTGVTILNPWDA